MSLKKNILQRVHESEDCPICVNILEIEEKVYTEPCNHVYCIWCLRKWFVYNTTCPMDRSKLTKVHVYDPIADDLKVLEIINFICEYICRERQNLFKVFKQELMRILFGCMENYNHVISLSNSLEKIYEIFTEGSFQMLLDMDPNDSKRGFDVFVQSINSIESEFRSKLQCLSNTIDENNDMIKEKIDHTKGYMQIYNDNDELVTHLKDLELFYKINGLLDTININIQGINVIYLFFKEQNQYDKDQFRYFYENFKISISGSRETILLNLNHVESLILQLPKP